MSEHTSRLLSLNEPAFAALRRAEYASFLVSMPDAKVVAATPPCAGLGVIEGASAPMGAKIVARTVAAAASPTARLERVRLPTGFVPVVFSCTTMSSALGRLVLFADPRALAPTTPTPLDPGGPQPGPRRDAARPLRFTWEADAQGRLCALSPAFVDALAPRLSAWRGRTFADLAADGVLRDVAPVVDLMAAGASFSNAVLWTGGAAARRIEIGGVPLFDGAKRRIGIRGFGLIWDASPEAAEPEAARNVVPLRGGTLSPRERSAFHEIARTLTDAIDGWPKPAAPPAPPVSPAPVSPPAPVFHAPPNAAIVSDSPDARVRASTAPPPETPGHETPRAPEASPTLSPMAEAEPPADAPSPPAPDPDGTAAPPPAARPAPTILPAARVPLDETLLDTLPFGLAVEQGGDLVHVNATLLAWAGTGDRSAFAATGGLGARLVPAAQGRGRFEMDGVDGARLPVEVRVMSVPWRGETARLTVVRRIEDAPPSIPPADVGAERALARSQALDVVPYAVFVLDQAGSIDELNRAAADLSGFARDELRGEPFALLFSSASQSAAVGLLDAAAAAPEGSPPGQASVTLRHRIGRETPMEAVLARATEMPPRFCLILRPPSAAETAQRDAPAVPAAASVLMSWAPPHDPATPVEPFVRRMSHAVRVPLTSILGFVEAVRASTFGPVGNSRYAKQAEAAALAGQHLLASLADIEHLLPVSTEDGREAVDINAVLDAAIDHIIPSARRRRILIRQDCETGLDTWFDPEALARALRLLLEEAVRATPSGGQVIVSARRRKADPGVVVMIRDGGAGLTEEEIAQALSPFRAAGTSDRFTSAGLPFRMARIAAVMRANGGELRLRRGVESGLLCEIHLPA
ncbi:PAS domain S-box protein [Aquabacter spiritensis]|uniref:histidine kinase n=1 Tax=Aquabacter spiritensis TaxID=933073 RepID=A0A4R3LMP1_9HYPH|nr:PAS domain S-box protein [Aquabacter spiritensis]TCT01582.1 PAS domain S-box-containing protein [Aquabacter spiritensis]